MTRTKSIIGALVLCALAISAFGAASASAKGLTAVECKNVGPENGNYNNSHCITPKVAKSEYDTVAFPLEETVKGIGGTSTVPLEAKEGEEHKVGTTANPAAIFHSTVGGIEVTVTCGTGHVTGSNPETIGAHLKNTTVGEEMKIHGTTITVTWTECHASPRTKPAKICTVQGLEPVTEPATPVGQIMSFPLTTTTGPEHRVTIKPEEGEKFTKFKINASGGECFLGAPIEVTVTGEAIGKANTTTHSHLTLNEATNNEVPGSLKANGTAASQTETVSGYTLNEKGEPTETTVGAETF